MDDDEVQNEPFLYFMAADEKRIGWRGRTADEAYDAYVGQEGEEPDFILGVLDDRPKQWRYEVLWESTIPEDEP